MNSENDLLLAALRKCIVGEMTWGCVRSYGSCFLLEFGFPELFGENRKIGNGLRRRVLVRGEWSLVVGSDNWTIQDDEGAVNSSDTQTDIDRFVSNLSGQTLKGISVTTEELILEFDRTARIAISRNDGDMDCLTVGVTKATVSVLYLTKS